jgi:hypothetical protein
VLWVTLRLLDQLVRVRSYVDAHGTGPVAGVPADQIADVLEQVCGALTLHTEIAAPTKQNLGAVPGPWHSDRIRQSGTNARYNIAHTQPSSYVRDRSGCRNNKQDRKDQREACGHGGVAALVRHQLTSCSHHSYGTDAFEKIEDGDVILAVDGAMVATTRDIERAVQVVFLSLLCPDVWRARRLCV